MPCKAGFLWAEPVKTVVPNVHLCFLVFINWARIIHSKTCQDSAPERGLSDSISQVLDEMKMIFHSRCCAYRILLAGMSKSAVSSVIGDLQEHPWQQMGREHWITYFWWCSSSSGS